MGDDRSAGAAPAPWIPTMSFDLYLWASAGPTRPADARNTYEALAVGRLEMPPNPGVRAAAADVKRRLKRPVEIYLGQGHLSISVPADRAAEATGVMCELADQYRLLLFDPQTSTVLADP